MLKRLTDHILCNNLHEQFQSAYKPNHSTETALMRVQNDILMSVDKKIGVVLIMLDLSAAFDTVDHSLLLGRMRSAGVIGIAHQWFESYSRVAQGAYLEVEYIRNVLSVSGTLKYADSGTA